MGNINLHQEGISFEFEVIHSVGICTILTQSRRNIFLLTERPYTRKPGKEGKSHTRCEEHR